MAAEAACIPWVSSLVVAPASRRAIDNESLRPSDQLIPFEFESGEISQPMRPASVEFRARGKKEFQC